MVKSEISRFFSKKEASDENTDLNKISTDVEVDSPYKNIVSEATPVLNNSLEDDNDFKSPKCFKLPSRQVKLIKSQTNKSRRGKQSRPKIIRGQKRLTSMIKENFVYSDVNAEHLQMALALSKSEQSDNEIAWDLDEASCSPSTKQRILGYRRTLEQFGFKSNKPVTRNYEVNKKSKKSKYQFVTPILNIRTEEDRQNLISSKISIILSSNSLPDYCYKQEKPRIRSCNLSKFVNEAAIIFNINNIEHKDLDIDRFYCKELNIEKNIVKSGHLLKDWSQIPGRETTPPRETCFSQSETITSEKINTNHLQIDNHNSNSRNSQNYIETRSLSPDLFTSDDENTSEIKRNIDRTLQTSLEMISNIKNFSLSQADVSNIDHTDNALEKAFEIQDYALQKTLNTTKKVSLYNASRNEGVPEVETSLGNAKVNYLEKEIVLISESESESEMLSTTNRKQSLDINLDTINTLNKDACIITDEENNISSPKLSIFDNKTFLLSESDSEIESSENELQDTTAIIKKTNFDLIRGCQDMEYIENPNKSLEINMDNTDDILGRLEISNNLKIDQKQSLEASQTISREKNLEITQTEDANQINLAQNNSQNPNRTNQFDSTDDILGTLEISLTNNVGTSMTPKSKIVAFSASLLSNLGSMNENETREPEKISSEDSDYNVTFQNLNGVEHFESFHDDELNITDQNASDTSIKNNYIYTKKEAVISNNLHSSILDNDNPPNIIDNILKLHLDKINIKTKPKSRIDNKILGKKTQIKRKYEILSDSSDDLETIDDLDNLKSKDPDGNINDLLEKSILNYEGLHPDLSKINLDHTQRNFPRKSLSFSPGTSTQSPKRDLKKYASFSTPIQNEIKEGNILDKYLSSSSISSENVDENGVMCISDEELNYSAIYGTPCKQQDTQKNEEKQNDYESYSYLEKYCDNQNYSTSKDITTNFENNSPKSPILHRRILELSSKKPSSIFNTPNSVENRDNTIPDDIARTPDGSVIIKTRNITPMPDFDSMTTPKIIKELEKVGIKQLKRHRGIQMLKHIYETTHPIWPFENEIGDESRFVKKRKLTKYKSRRRLEIDNCTSGEIPPVNIVGVEQPIEIIGDISDSEILLFERKQSKRIPSCPLPLHIAWHNLVSSNPELKQNILLYEPLQLEVLYTQLKDQGHKYHIQDLLTFLDKKCITFRTIQNNRQRKNRF